MSPAITVVVPVYKVELYIRKCLDSILSQTFTDFELLLIDDGSPDNCGAICDEYASKDKRIRVFHKENGGVSTARQLGMDKAQGEYIIHADPDDWVDFRWLELLYTKANKTGADITICDYYEVSSEKALRKDVVKSETPLECLENLLLWKLPAQLWNKLIKRELYEKHNIRITPGLDLREDSSIMYKLLFFSNKVSFVDEALYYYYIGNQNSLVHNLMSTTHQEDLIILENEIQEFRMECVKDSKLLHAFIIQDFITLGYLVMNGNSNILKENKNLLENITFYDITHCPYQLYKPIFILRKLKLYHLIPLYVFIYKTLKNKM